MLQPGDTILGMSLAHGGHLTHGSPVNFSGKLFHVVSYGLDKNEEIDYEEVERLASEHRPTNLRSSKSQNLTVWSALAETKPRLSA